MKYFKEFDGLSKADILKVIYWIISMILLSACESHFIIVIAVVLNFCLSSLVLKSVKIPESWKH